jgi:hypothetical protein
MCTATICEISRRLHQADHSCVAAASGVKRVYANSLSQPTVRSGVQRCVSVDQPQPSNPALQPVDRDHQLVLIQNFDQTINRNFWTRDSDFKMSVDNFFYLNNGVKQ